MTEKGEREGKKRETEKGEIGEEERDRKRCERESERREAEKGERGQGERDRDR